MYMHVLGQYPEFKEFCTVIISELTGKKAGRAAMPISLSADDWPTARIVNFVSEKPKTASQVNKAIKDLAEQMNTVMDAVKPAIEALMAKMKRAQKHIADNNWWHAKKAQENFITKERANRMKLVEFYKCLNDAFFIGLVEKELGKAKAAKQQEYN